MDDGKDTTLVEALAGVPDPRKRRGQRFAWKLLVTLVSGAMASGQQSPHAVGQWVREHGEALAKELAWGPKPLPSESTLRRVLRKVDVAAREKTVEEFSAGLPDPTPAPALRGLALDGKEIRGSRAHGVVVHLVGRARDDGRVLVQTAVAHKTNEIVAAPQLLKGRDLQGSIVTVDALLAQRALARQIHEQGGYSLMQIKENQPQTLAAIATLFADPPPGEAVPEARVQTVDKGHGRRESRTLETSSALRDYLTWPGLEQVLRRTCRRRVGASGDPTEEVHDAITNLPTAKADAACLEQVWRGHWGIENRVHYPRDVSFGEDQGQAYRGNTAHALATLRNACLNLFRFHGWKSIADALRHYGASPDRALALIGAGRRL